MTQRDLERLDQFGAFTDSIIRIDVSLSGGLVLRLWEASQQADNNHPESLIPGARPLGQNKERYLELSFARVGAVEIREEFLVRKDRVELDWPKMQSAVFGRLVPYPIVRVHHSIWRSQYDMSDSNYSELNHISICSMDTNIDVLTEGIPMGRWQYSGSDVTLN